MSTLQTGHSPAEAVAPAAGEVGTAAPRASILLVDDQPARLLSYEAILYGLGVRCVRALSGPQALERLLEQEFAAILLDVNMPEMDGFEVARLVREHPRLERTPIIFVTAVHVSELDRLKGYELGAIDYIAVPVVPEILRSKVAVLVELFQRRGQLKALNAALSTARTKLDTEHQQALAERDAQLQAIFEHPTDINAVLKAERIGRDRGLDLRERESQRHGPARSAPRAGARAADQRPRPRPRRRSIRAVQAGARDGRDRPLRKPVRRARSGRHVVRGGQGLRDQLRAGRYRAASPAGCLGAERPTQG